MKNRRLALEHLENRVLLSATPGISRLVAAQAHSTAGAAATATQLYLISQPVIQGGVQTTVQLVALDSSGRVVRNFNDQVSLSSTDTTATLPATVTVHNGQASFPVTFNDTTAEQPTITATDTSVTPNLTGSVTPYVTAIDVASSYYATIKPTVQSGVATTVQIYALDANGYVVHTYNGTATLTLGVADSAATIPATVTFHNGQASFKVTLVQATTTAAPQAITIADSAAKLSTTVSTNVTAPAAVSLYTVNLRSRVQSGVPVTVQILALDATGHVVTGYTGTVNLTTSDTLATIVSSTGTTISSTTPVTFQNGIATVSVTFATSGVQYVYATDATSGETVPKATGTTDVVTSLNPSPTPIPTTPSSNQATTSTNWSGYAAQAKQGAVTAVSGSWTVPAVTGTSTAYSAVWVGIDGYQSSTVEQIGTESDVSNGTPSYSVWYEMYPNMAVTIPITSMTVSAGDNITASVQYVSGQFVLTITDTSRPNDTFTISETASNAQRSSAEWIVEAPSSNAGVLPLANFTSVAFSNATATINGTSGAIDNSPAWQSTAINMVSYGRSLEATTSALTDTAATQTTPASSSFTVTFDSSGGSSSSTIPGLGGGGGWGGGGGGGWRKTNIAAASNVVTSHPGGAQSSLGNQFAALDAMFATRYSFHG